jgi:hypothetical protein
MVAKGKKFIVAIFRVQSGSLRVSIYCGGVACVSPLGYVKNRALAIIFQDGVPMSSIFASTI